MVIVNDIMINNLIRQKDTLIKQFEIQHTIDEKTYRKKVQELDIELYKHNSLWIKQEQDRIKEEEKQAAIKKNHWKQIIEQKAVDDYKTKNGDDKMGIFDMFKKPDTKVVDIEIKDAEIIKPIKIKTKKKINKIMVKKVKVPSKEKKSNKEPSLRSTIIKVLSEGKVKTHVETCIEVKKLLPNTDDKKIMFFIRYIIGQVKLKNERFSKYSWDEAKYLIKVI